MNCVAKRIENRLVESFGDCGMREYRTHQLGFCGFEFHRNPDSRDEFRDTVTHQVVEATSTPAAAANQSQPFSARHFAVPKAT